MILILNDARKLSRFASGGKGYHVLIAHANNDVVDQISQLIQVS